MKLVISTESARAAALTAIAARVFIGLALEESAVHNGAWLCALLGGAVSVPWVLAADWLRNRRNALSPLARGPLYLALLLGLTADAAVLLSDVTRSAGYLALDRSSPVILLIPACLAVLWCALRNGGAIGYGAMVWVRLFTALLLVVAILQFKHYRPEWLRPLLGPGWPQIGFAGARTTLRIMLASGVLLVSGDVHEPPREGAPLLRTLAAAIGIAALLLALHLMMTPVMVAGGKGWLNRLDSLIVNGRAPLYLQLPMLIIWFAALMHLLVCECFTAAAALQHLLPRLSGRVCALLIVLATGLLCRTRAMSDGGIEAFSRWSAVALSAAVALAILTSLPGKGGADPCVR